MQFTKLLVRSLFTKVVRATEPRRYEQMQRCRVSGLINEVCPPHEQTVEYNHGRLQDLRFSW
jgi:hypothetical protein